MPATTILDIANGVADILGEYNADVVFAPDYNLKDMKDMRVVVLPVGRELAFATRTAKDNTLSVEVGVIHKCREQAAVPQLILKVEEIGLKLHGARVGTCSCMKVKWEPMFSVEDLRSRGLFIGVIHLSFKEFTS